MSDPINPAHYNGTACAEIGERLSANSYQVLKYNWRLGKKDDPVIEVGKSIWYLDREIVLADAGFRPIPFSVSQDFFAQRLVGVDLFVETVALALINWNLYGDKITLEHLRYELIAQRARLEAASSGQLTMEI